MMVTLNGNIVKLKIFVRFIADDLDFMKLIEKKKFTFEM